jgi:GNAT superfamily N-acetyltransferase
VVGLVTAVLREPMLFAQSPRGLVENLMVRPSCRRGGIGRRLLEAAVVWCEARGAVVVEATVAAGNSEAAAFWRACGFEPVTTSMTRACRQGTDRG